eukprot:218674_1
MKVSEASPEQQLPPSPPSNALIFGQKLSPRSTSPVPFFCGGRVQTPIGFRISKDALDRFQKLSQRNKHRKQKKGMSVVKKHIQWLKSIQAERSKILNDNSLRELHHDEVVKRFKERSDKKRREIRNTTDQFEKEEVSPKSAEKSCQVTARLEATENISAAKEFPTSFENIEAAKESISSVDLTTKDERISDERTPSRT